MPFTGTMQALAGTLAYWWIWGWSPRRRRERKRKSRPRVDRFLSWDTRAKNSLFRTPARPGGPWLRGISGETYCTLHLGEDLDVEIRQPDLEKKTKDVQVDHLGPRSAEPPRTPGLGRILQGLIGQSRKRFNRLGDERLPLRPKDKQRLILPKISVDWLGRRRRTGRGSQRYRMQALPFVPLQVACNRNQIRRGSVANVRELN